MKHLSIKSPKAKFIRGGPFKVLPGSMCEISDYKKMKFEVMQQGHKTIHLFLRTVGLLLNLKWKDAVFQVSRKNYFNIQNI